MQDKNSTKKQSPEAVKNLVMASMLLAIGMVLPFLTGQIKEIGDSLLPMHLAVMLCGVFCGYKYGLAVGAALPLLRSALFGMPPIYPNAIWMSFELATYGFVIGLLYCNIFKKRFRCIFIALPIAQILGRVVWGISKAILLGIGGHSFTIAAFISGGFTDALLGIVLQWLLIPLITIIECRNGKNRFYKPS